jgi:hypothetical protein
MVMNHPIIFNRFHRQLLWILLYFKREVSFSTLFILVPVSFIDFCFLWMHDLCIAFLWGRVRELCGFELSVSFWFSGGVVIILPVLVFQNRSSGFSLFLTYEYFVHFYLSPNKLAIRSSLIHQSPPESSLHQPPHHGSIVPQSHKSFQFFRSTIEIIEFQI